MENKQNTYSPKSPHGSFVAGIAKKILRIVPDRIFLSFTYRRKMHKKCNFKNPTTFNEKLQWLKLHDRNKLFTDLSDKIKAKKIVSELLGENYVVPTLAEYTRPKDIDINKLPNQFVLKCNHDCGSVTVVRDKASLDLKETKKRLKRHLNYNYYSGFREWPYKNIKRKIFAEQYIESEDGSSMIDYKFFCFNGEPKFLYVSQGLENHKTASISFFDFNGKQLPFKRSDFSSIKGDYKLPDSFSQMKEIARKLASFSKAKFIRIDLYTINKRIYFSEFTFFPCAGFLPFEPESADFDVGQLINLK